MIEERFLTTDHTNVPESGVKRRKKNPPALSGSALSALIRAIRGQNAFGGNPAK
jgi:hypothetical protein